MTMPYKRTIPIYSILVFMLCMSGCMTPMEYIKSAAGVSTKELKDARKNALVKVFNCDYDTCYRNTLWILNRVPYASIYDREKDLIALYCTDVNSTTVGVFFKKIDSKHTQVDIASQGSDAKEWIAKNVFSGKIQKPRSTKRSF